MSPDRIRALRGQRTRTEFARVLGVAPLTVLRWELPEDNKEARRPRRAVVATLEKLEAAERDAAQAGGNHGESLDPALAEDITNIRRVRDMFGTGAWRRAEMEMLALLADGRLTTLGGRALATLDVVQQQLLSRLDVRSALTAILPLITDVDAGRLPGSVAARVHVGAAMLFSAPDARLFDPGRVNAHAAAAERLLPPTDEARIVLALARLSATRYIGVDVFMRTHREVQHLVTESPILRCLLAILMRLGAEPAGRPTTPERLNLEALEVASQIGLHALVIGSLANGILVGLATCLPATQILKLAGRARDEARLAGVGPIDPLVRALAGEADAYLRLGRVEDAKRSLSEARELAARAGVPPFACAAAEVHLYAHTNDPKQLARLASELEAEVVPSMRGLVRGLALYARATSASLEGDHERASQLADDAFALCDDMAAIGFVPHDVLIEAMLARALSSDVEGARRVLRRAEALHERFPSAYHGALRARVEGLLLLAESRAAEALVALEASLAPLVAAEDHVQLLFGRCAIALAQRETGDPRAEERFRGALDEASALGVVPRPLAASHPALGAGMADRRPAPRPSLADRLTEAADTLIGRSTNPDALPRQLLRAAEDVLPGHTAVVESTPPPPPTASSGEPRAATVQRWFELTDERGKKLHFGVAGAIDDEQAAALRTLVASAQRGLSASITRSADPSTTANDPDILPELPDFVAAAPAMRHLRRSIARLSGSRATILVTGESGTGKEVVARAVHDLSTRAHRPYVAFNCATVPRDLFESQLFGHKRGSFTGADRDELGVLRAADKGTVFLDEIGELPLDVQPKLLRFIENGEVFPLGERKPIAVDVRVVAATHRDLAKLVREGAFREDLFYRLNVVPLHVPPLRDRPEDVIALAHRFLSRFTPEGVVTPRLGPDALVALTEHGWPGNVRELRNVLERTLAFGVTSHVLSAAEIRF